MGSAIGLVVGVVVGTGPGLAVGTGLGTSVGLAAGIAVGTAVGLTAGSRMRVGAGGGNSVGSFVATAAGRGVTTVAGDASGVAALAEGPADVRDAGDTRAGVAGTSEVTHPAVRVTLRPMKPAANNPRNLSPSTCPYSGASIEYFPLGFHA